MTAPATQLSLRRGLTAFDVLGLLIGVVIGTGIFLKSAVMAQAVGSPILLLCAWILAGLVSMAGVLTFAELGAMLPESGGEYAFIRAAYGDGPSFAAGWTRFVIGASGVAGIAVAIPTFLSPIFDFGPAWVDVTRSAFGHSVHWAFGVRQVVASALVLGVGALNCAGVVVSGRTQTVLAAIKVVTVLGIAIAILTAAPSGEWGRVVTTGNAVSLTTFGGATLAAMWAYNGWSHVAMVAGEVRDPGRNIPRGTITGMLIVMALYVSLNVAYLYALPFAEIQRASSTLYPTAPSVATKAIETVVGASASRLVAVVFSISALAAVNGGVLATSRIPFAMARNGVFPRAFGAVGRNTRAPVVAIAAFTLWTALLASSGTYDQLTDAAIFTFLVIYVTAASAVIVLRVRQPDLPRPYRTLGYPVVPLLFIVTASWVIVSTLVTSPVSAWSAIAMATLGLPIYLLMKRQSGIDSKRG